MKLKETFISDIDGNPLEVTDLEGALHEAKSAISFLEDKERAHKKNPEVIIFPKALKFWKHVLLELQKLAIKIQNNTGKTIKEKEHTPSIKFMHPTVKKMRDIFGHEERSEKMFAKENSKGTSLFPLEATYRTRRPAGIDELEIGEATTNGGGTILRRIY